MFTGLIETTGTFLNASMSGKAGKLRIESRKILTDPVPGESIAVNGACLTLEKASGPVLEFHVLEETFRKTNLGLLQRGAQVNLERAMALGDRFGGHIVSGHVDGTGKILALGRSGDDIVLTVSCSPELRQYMCFLLFFSCLIFFKLFTIIVLHLLYNTSFPPSYPANTVAQHNVQENHVDISILDDILNFPFVLLVHFLYALELHQCLLF